MNDLLLGGVTIWLLKSMVMKVLFRTLAAGLVMVLIRAVPIWGCALGVGLLIWWAVS